MRANIFKYNGIKTAINEIKMNKARLLKAVSTNKYGVKIGFEAELIFPEYLSQFTEDEEPVVFYTEDDVEHWLNYHDGIPSSIARSVLNDLRDQASNYFREKFAEEFLESGEGQELIKEHLATYEYDYDELIVKKIMGNEDVSAERAQEMFKDESDEYEQAKDDVEEFLDEKALESLRNRDSNFEEVFDSFLNDSLDSVDIDDYREFLDNNGIHDSNDLIREYDIEIDHEFEDNFHVPAAESLADSLSDAIRLSRSYIEVNDRYHGSEKDLDIWYLEPDSSIEADDTTALCVEIVSPPMPLEDAIVDMERFFKWVKKMGGITNESTGLHVSMSFDDESRYDNVDFLKLAVMSGDNKTLEEFDRVANTYCEHYFEKLKKHSVDLDNVVQIMDALKTNLSDGAKRIMSLKKDKYVSINVKDDYVEFRSMGGENYQNRLDDVLLNIGRFATALNAAADPTIDRQNYMKKLYKLLSPSKGSDLDVFVRYAAGDISKEVLKKEWASNIIPGRVKQGGQIYHVIDKQTNTIVAYVSGWGEDEAIANAYSKMQEKHNSEYAKSHRKDSSAEYAPLTMSEFKRKYEVSHTFKKAELSKRGKTDPDQLDTEVEWIVYSDRNKTKVETTVHAKSYKDALQQVARQYNMTATHAEASFYIDRAGGQPVSGNDSISRRTKKAMEILPSKTKWVVIDNSTGKVVHEFETEFTDRYSAVIKAAKDMGVPKNNFSLDYTVSAKH